MGSWRWVLGFTCCLACGKSPAPTSVRPVDHDASDAARGPMPDAALANDAEARARPDASYAPVVSDPDCPHPKVHADCKDGFCRIPAGCFVMGSPETEWGHPAYAEEQKKVILTHPFEMQQYEVTQKEWTAQGFANPSGREPDGTGDCSAPECPVGNVNGNEVAAYANLLSERHVPPLKPCYELSDCQGELGQGMQCSTVSFTAPTAYECEGYRLATDAEREYAARAGTRTAFYTGDITQHETAECLPDAALEAIAWYCHNAKGKTHPVGQLLPNGWGLYDMAGNVLEWGSDAYRGLPSDGGTNPGGTWAKALPRTLRGGTFQGPAKYCRAAWQSNMWFGTRGPGVGFRLVRTLRE